MNAMQVSQRATFIYTTTSGSECSAYRVMKYTGRLTKEK